MFKNTFMLKIYPKASKKLKFTSICSDDHGGFVTPSDHCALCVAENLNHFEEQVVNLETLQMEVNSCYRLKSGLRLSRRPNGESYNSIYN